MTITASDPVGAGSTVFDVVGRPTRNGPTWVWTRYDLDLATVPAARAELDALLSGLEPSRFVLVYLGDERFVDVRGMRLLIDATRTARTRGGDLVVVAPPYCLRRMTSHLGLTDELSLVPGARQAMRRARVRGRA